VNHDGDAPNIQRFHQPTGQTSLVIAANYDVGVVQAAVLESLGSVVRPFRSWALPGPGEFADAPRSLGVTRRTFEIGPLLGMAQSLLTEPRVQACWLSPSWTPSSLAARG
jgi:hypothetical protein